MLQNVIYKVALFKIDFKGQKKEVQKTSSPTPDGLITYLDLQSPKHC